MVEHSYVKRDPGFDFRLRFILSAIYATRIIENNEFLFLIASNSVFHEEQHKLLPYLISTFLQHEWNSLKSFSKQTYNIITCFIIIFEAVSICKSKIIGRIRFLATLLMIFHDDKGNLKWLHLSQYEDKQDRSQAG